MFLFVIIKKCFDSPGTSFPPHSLQRSQAKLVLYSRFSDTFSEALQTYTFLVMIFIVGEIKSTRVKYWKIKHAMKYLV